MPDSETRSPYWTSPYDSARVEGPFERVGSFRRFNWYVILGWLYSFNDFEWVEFAGAKSFKDGELILQRRSYPEQPWLGGDPT